MKIETTHKIITGASQNLNLIKDNSIELVITSPPYPMIEMWDEVFGNQNPQIKNALQGNEPSLVFELMHRELDKVWSEVVRVLRPGGFACINIGDATRTIAGDFRLYPNHSRIISSFQNLGISNLPNIIWRKQTNAPNKFMGSGMLPSGAYVTLEHEWILIFRKGEKRQFKTEGEKLKRKLSSFFWEERNNWFSDLWDLKGTKQAIDNSESRKRSAAYPFEIPYRLINMYSLQGDTVLDPFLGIGTTILAAIGANRNSIGCEIDSSFVEISTDIVLSTPINQFNNIIENRIEQHKRFIIERGSDVQKENLKHFNKNLNLPVMTSQETEIKFYYVTEIKQKDNEIAVSYDLVKPSESFVYSTKKKSTDKTLFDL